MQVEHEQLTDVIFKLQSDKIIDYNYDGKTLRLVVESVMASNFIQGTDVLNLVLTNCTEVFYLSYTQSLENREIQDVPDQIFSKGLAVQGVECREITHFIIYCNSYLNTVEAGELHVTATGFQLYDQEFGRINLNTFNRIANKLDRY